MIFNSKKDNHQVAEQEPVSGIDAWLQNEEVETEGQLALDVFQTEKKIVVKSTIAGARPEDLKISLHNDLLTIKGHRTVKEEVREEDYLFRECYWGAFSRAIILPAEVDNKKVEAELENGVLTITLYKTKPGLIEVKARD